MNLHLLTVHILPAHEFRGVLELKIYNLMAGFMDMLCRIWVHRPTMNLRQC